MIFASTSKPSWLLLGLVWALFCHTTHAQLASQLTQFVGTSRFEALSLVQGDFNTCRSTRQALISGPDSDNYYRLLRSVRADLIWLQTGAILTGTAQATSVTGLIPPVSEGPVASSVQMLLTLGIEFFTPTNFFTIMVDMLRMLCDGTSRDVLKADPEPGSRLQRIKLSINQLVFRINEKRGRATNLERSERGGVVFSRINKGAPFVVLQVTVFALNVLLRLGRILGNIPLAPFRAVGRASQVSLRSPKEVLEFINNRLENVCDSTEGTVGRIVTVMNILSYLRAFIAIVGPLISFIIPKTDIPRVDEEYRNLLTDEIRNIADCPTDLYVLPTRSDGLFAAAEFYGNQVNQVNQLLAEFPPQNNGFRALQNNEFTAEMDDTEAAAIFLTDFTNSIQSVEDTINNAIQGVLQAANVDLTEVVEALLIRLPNEVEDLTNRVGEFFERMEPVIEVFQAVVDVIPDPPSPFGAILDFLGDLVCEAVNVFGFIFGVDDLCGQIEDLIGNFLSEALGILSIPDPDFFGELFDFSIFDSITESLNLDLEFIVDLQSFVPAELLAQFGQFFDPEQVFENLSGLLTRFTVTPADVLSRFVDPPSGLPPGIQTGSSLSVDSTLVDFNCPVGTTPVTVRADFITDNCRDELVGQLRFPCANSANTCQRDVEELLFCNIPEPDAFINTHLGLPVTRLSVTYLCFTNLGDFKFTPVLIDGRTSVTLEREGPSSERSFDDSLVEDVAYEEALPLFTDTYQRGSFLVRDVSATPMNCAGGALDREIFLASIERYIDPCVNGASYPYHSQFDPRTIRETDACGYKVLFDENLIAGCSHDKQSFVGQKRLGSRSTVLWTNQNRLLQGSSICWQDPNDCNFVNVGFGGGRCEPQNNYEINWETIANNLEQCEYYYFPTTKGTQVSIDECPFRDYLGLKFFQGDEGDSAPQNYGFVGACESSGSPKLYELPPPKNAVPFQNRFFRNPDFQDFTDRTGNVAFHADCSLRDALENDIEFADNQPFPSSSSYQNARSNSRQTFQRWEGDLNDNELRCFGDGSSPGAIETCINDPSKICDLAAINCVPPDFDWACIVPPENRRLVNREFLFSQVQESKTVSCATQIVDVGGVNTEVALELEILSVLELSNLISETELTQPVLDHCQLGPGITSCTFDPGTIAFPPANSNPVLVWEIDSTCKCPAGYERDPNEDGFCQPCDAGFARANGVTVCEICPSGSVSSAGAESCVDCPPGFFQTETGEQECAPCSSGEYAEGPKAPLCILCPPGSFQPNFGQGSCQSVDPGYFQPSEGQGAQRKCPPGTFSAANSTECQPCLAGEFSRDGSENQCELCPEGTYSILQESSSCTPCPQGFFATFQGATSCDRCPAGLTTAARGAADVTECGPPTDLALLAEILERGSSPEFNLPEMTILPDNGLEGRSVTVSVGCRDLLLEYIDGATSDNVDFLLEEVGNGYCNRGPWNTAACGWDGGDCCPQTCETLFYSVDAVIDPDEVLDLTTEEEEEATLASRRCLYLNFECRDPVALGGGLPPSSRCVISRRNDRRKLRTLSLFEFLSKEEIAIQRASFRAAWLARRTSANHSISRQQQRHLQTPQQAGDGVCNPELNNEANNFDDGDCCPSTCIFNPIYARESCDPAAFLDIPIGQGCESGVGCCDPLVTGNIFEVADEAPPLVQAVPDFRVECGATITSALLQGPPPFPVSVSDNNACFSWNGQLSDFSRVIIDRDAASCGGATERIDFQLSAVDNANNVGTKTVQAFFEDTLPPVLDCPEPITVSVTPGETEIQLPVTMALDQCSGSIQSVYTSMITGINIDTNGIMTGWEGSGTPLALTLTATDACGLVNAEPCTVDVHLVTEMPSATPSMEPSSQPSESVAPSSVPSSTPSNSPSLPPTMSPTSSPTESPTSSPTSSPTASPTSSPTTSPTNSPTASPTESPTSSPTVFPRDVNFVFNFLKRNRWRKRQSFNFNIGGRRRRRLRSAT